MRGSQAAAGTARTKPLILICEDDRDARTIVRMSLELCGFEICEAEHGRRAQEVCRAALPDLILLDLMMPEMSGMEFLAWLRAEFAEPYVPVLLLTALTQIDNKVAGLASGADDYLVKPFERRELEARVRALLRIKQLTDGLRQKNVELSAAQSALVASERELLRAQLAGAAAHELGQPLQAVLLQLHLFLKKHGADVDACELAEAIRGECERMQSVLEKLKSSDDQLTDYAAGAQILAIK